MIKMRQAITSSGLQGTMLIVRVTQDLMNDGWHFKINNRDEIECAIHNDNNERKYFYSPTELKNWLYEKAEDF